jgi:hypothetical protein
MCTVLYTHQWKFKYITKRKIQILLEQIFHLENKFKIFISMIACQMPDFLMSTVNIKNRILAQQIVRGK